MSTSGQPTQQSPGSSLSEDRRVSGGVSGAGMDSPVVQEETPTTMNSPTPDAGPTVASSSHLLDDPRLNETMLSDAGPTALLARLKQSIVSTREFATFVKKKAQFESEHQMGMKKLARHTCESIRKPDGRQGTFVRQFEQMVKMNDRMADVGNTYVAALHVMHDELSELAKSIEKSRKNVKETCLRNEKNVSEAESMAEKAKAKYDSLCEDFERMRTGDPKSKFGFKQSKTPQHEEELHRKVTAAEQEYRQRVDQAQKARNELIHKLRPVSVKELKELTLECDSAISLQLQKYANLTETLALNSGFIVAPLKPAGGSLAGPQSMKELAAQVDNERDFYDSVMRQSSAKEINRTQVQFKQHPSLASAYPSTISSATPPKPSPAPAPAPAPPQPNKALPPTAAAATAADSAASTPQPGAGSPPPPQTSTSPPPMLDPVRTSTTDLSPADTRNSTSEMYPPGTASSMPSYGTVLEDLLDYEEGTVPRVVYQCIRAIDNFGLEVEGIYRTNGNQNQVQEIKRMFDADSANVDLLHPSANVNDIHAVASALKQYFHELPDPLLTAEYHDEFVRAAQIDNDVQRRDAIHATINKLPDPNYTTLRYLVFHLYRVQEREAINRMSIVNLGIVWGPALSAVDYNNVGEMALLGRIVETILFNAYVIFDAE